MSTRVLLEKYIIFRVSIVIKFILNFCIISAFIFFSSCKPEILNAKKISEINKIIFDEVEPVPTVSELKKMRQDLLLMMGEFSLFNNAETESIILDWQMYEWRKFGTADMWDYHKTTSYKNTVIMQRSDHHRLYDHNIILRNLFKGKIYHHKMGDLSKLFKNAVFLDIGSAILFEEGAPTVRDIYSDKEIAVNLSSIVATDINVEGARFIDIYNRERQNLPFPVREVNIRMINVDQFLKLTEGLLDDATPLIIRSSNSGPDLYYPPREAKEHLRAVIRTFYDRNLIYFFNKFILIKFKDQTYFECLGRDSGTGVDHMNKEWEDVDWNNRKLNQSFIPESSVASIKE